MLIIAILSNLDHLNRAKGLPLPFPRLGEAKAGESRSINHVSHEAGLHKKLQCSLSPDQVISLAIVRCLVHIVRATRCHAKLMSSRPSCWPCVVMCLVQICLLRLEGTGQIPDSVTTI